jgi:hypothetical protein
VRGTGVGPVLAGQLLGGGAAMALTVVGRRQDG